MLSFKSKSFNCKVIIAIINGLLLLGCSSYHNKRGNFNNNYDPDHYDSVTFYGENITPEQEKALLSENTIYFGYDREDLSSRYQLILSAHAKNLMENPSLNLRINGHTDERGSAEYNIGLGERRAKSVARFIEMKGVNSNRLVTVSYGKEKPAAMGSNEEAWRLNRRAELNYE